ncbi:type II and III secretion system protein family protein [Emcibacter sp.]|uniref:type II and III secretion system protein family protein n=1 Tax=Emcibacter sp. TaxID=1979954 RepID=UPI003A921332
MTARKNIRRLTGKTMKKSAFCLIAVFSLLLGSLPFASAFAQQQEHIQVEVSKGTLLRLKQPASNIFIADPSIADIQVKSPTLVYIFGKKQGETSLYGVSDEDEILLSGEISVTHNLGSLESALKSVMPDARISVKSYEGLLVMTGHVESPDQAEEARRMAAEFIGQENTIINRLTIATPVQVNLRVRIAEVGRDTMKQLGFNWQNSFINGSTAIGMFQGSQVFDAVDGVKEFFSLNRGNNFAGGFRTGNFDINFIIDAMEQEGVLSVLAEPNLTTISGESASFLAGGEYPIPVIEDRQLSITYKEYGVALDFKPTVVDSGKISMHIKPEVSQLSSAGAVTLDGFSIPALTTRRAETTVEVGSGQSFAIAGLIQNNVTNNIAKYPWLGDIPILGALFRSTEFQRQETELVIIVTPYIVKPHNGSNMPLPNDNFRVANDMDLFLSGHSYENRSPDTAPAAQGKTGEKMKSAAGFMLD